MPLATEVYEYEAEQSGFSLDIGEAGKYWVRYDLEFEGKNIAEGDVERTSAGGDLYLPKHPSCKSPLVILLHGIGDHSVIPCAMVAKTLAKRGYASLVIYLPIHTTRMTADVKKRFPSITNDEWLSVYRNSVVEIRKILDWAKSREDIDDKNCAVIGISFGGFVSAIAMGVEKRLKAGVLIVAGGNGGKINQLSKLSSVAKKFRFTPEEYEERQKVYLSYLEEVREKGVEKVALPNLSFIADPMTYAPSLKERPIMMINAQFDEAIPREATIDLWTELGKPQINWYPTTHASLWICYPSIKKKILKFLKNSL